MTWTRSSLADAFRAAGLGVGDLVLVHSALRKLGPIDGGADAVIDALLDTVGRDGTVAMPSHTWKVVNRDQPVFHQTLTPSNVGALSNIFRLRPAAVRSLHPTHSIAAIGPRALALTEGHERDRTPCPAGGPYERLCTWGGKVLIIGADLACCTLFHGCEEWASMPWVASRDAIPLTCIAADGRSIPVTMRGHITNTWDQYPRLEPHLIAAGALRVTQIHDCQLRLLDARLAADWLIERLRSDPSIVLPPT
ncbi:MAG: AAC(3) family N-acetyltransferase [Planctomycetota bacterium]